jgi:hypothetical protein
MPRFSLVSHITRSGWAPGGLRGSSQIGTSPSNRRAQARRCYGGNYFFNVPIINPDFNPVFTETTSENFASEVFAAAGIESATATKAIKEYTEQMAAGAGAQDPIAVVNSVASDNSINLPQIYAAMINMIISFADQAGLDTSNVLSEFNDAKANGTDPLAAVTGIAQSLASYAKTESQNAMGALAGAGVSPTALQYAQSTILQLLRSGDDPLSQLSQIVQTLVYMNLMITVEAVAVAGVNVMANLLQQLVDPSSYGSGSAAVAT